MLKDGTLAAEGAVRLLRERVRRGELTPEHVALLAYCGQQPARLMEADGRDEVDFESWLAGLVRWGRYVSVMAAVHIADSLVGDPALDTDHAMAPHSSRPRLVVIAASQWLLEPTPERARAVQARTGSAPRIADDEHWWRHIASLIDWLGTPPITGATPENLPGERMRLIARCVADDWYRDLSLRQRLVPGGELRASGVRLSVEQRLIQWASAGGSLTGPS